VPETARRTLEANLDSQSVPEAWRRQLCPGKKCEVGAGMAFRVRVEQVIRAGIVLVDRLLDEPHPENACVEIEVFLRRTGNGGDGMKSVDALHGASPGFLPNVPPNVSRQAEPSFLSTPQRLVGCR